MVDCWANTIVHPTMEDIAEYVPAKVSADTITLAVLRLGWLQFLYSGSNSIHWRWYLFDNRFLMDLTVRLPVETVSRV